MLSQLPTTHSDQIQPAAPAAAPSTRRWLARAAVAAMGVTCAAGVALGLYSVHGEPFQHDALRFLEEMASSDGIQITFVPKASANLPNGTSFHGYLIPKNSGNSSATLSFDGRLSYTFNNHEYNFTILDNHGFMTVENTTSGTIVTNDCLDADNTISVDTFTEALLTARVVDDTGDFEVDCAGGKLVEFTLEDEPYVFCGKKDKTYNVHGDDMQASIKILKNNTAGLPTRDQFTRPQGLPSTACDVIRNTTTTTTTTRALLQKSMATAKDAMAVLSGKPRRSLLGASSCSCTGGTKACLFVHGLGHTGTGTVSDSFSDYWGDIATEATCCSSTKFIQMDTTNNAWYADTLPKQVCAAALAMVSSTDDMNMENIALIGHSMGNLIIASAIMKGLCGIDTSTSKWISLAGPMQGSMSANLAINVCTLASTSAATLAVLEFFGLCPTGASTISLAYDGTSDSTTALNAYYTEAAAVYTKYVTSNMCGTSPEGLLTIYSPEYVLLSALSDHATSENDGAVEISSCRDGLSSSLYSTSYDGGNYYKAALNHKDISLYNGDGWYGAARKPVKWFNCQF